MTDDMNLDNVKKLCEEIGLVYKTDHNMFCAYFPGEDYELDYAVFTFDYNGKEDYAFCHSEMNLEYCSYSNNLKIRWSDRDADEQEIWNITELKEQCERLFDVYRQFKLYKKEFSQNKRINKIKEDFNGN